MKSISAMHRGQAFCLAWAAAGLVGVTVVTPPAAAQVPSALIQEDGTLPGAPKGHTISAINNPAVNHGGGFAFLVNTTDGVTTLSHAWGNATGGAGTVIRTEGTFGPYTQTAWESFFGMGDLGEIAYSPTCNGGPVASADTVWRDDTPLAFEGLPMSNVPGFETQFWRFASRAGCSADGRASWIGGITSTSGGSTENIGLFIEDGKHITPLIYGGQTVPNLPAILDSAGNPASVNYRMSSLATSFITEVDMVGSTASDGAIVVSGEGLLVDGQLVREGSPVPAAAGGVGGETWGPFDLMGITESGEYFINGDTSAATTADEYIFKNGQMLHREGDVIDGAIVTSAVQHAYMNEDGDIAYVWEIAGDTANFEALFINDTLLLIEGDMVDLDGDGTVEPTSTLRDFTGISALVVSDRDAEGNVSLYFTADVDINGTPSTLDDVEGGFRMVVSLALCPADTDGSGAVDVDDLVAVILGWGTCTDCDNCPADIDNSCEVDVDDLVAVILAWGPCT